MKLKLFILLICSQWLLLATGRAQGCAPLPLSGCNYIPNPQFTLIDPSGLNSAFSAGNVVNWGGYELSVDINAGGNAQLAAPPLPAAIAGVNYASSQVNNPNYGESMAARIRKVEAGKKYALSFFLSSTMPYSFWDGATFTFKIILSKCNVTGAPEQLIYCVAYDKLRSSDWAQYFVSFTANDDYDLIIVKPEVPTTGSFGYTYLHFAYPELISVTDLITASDVDPQCQLTLSACGVKNAIYEWVDVMGNTVGNHSSLDVNAATARGYTLNMTVPASVTPNNNCSENFPIIKVHQELPQGCNCGTLRITDALAGYYKWGVGGLYREKLDICNNTILCDNGNELLTLALSSSEPLGNRWEFFTNNPQIPIDRQFNYTTGNAGSQYIEGFVGFNPSQTGIIEIRLSNSILNEVKSVFFKIVSHWDDPNQCNFFNRTAAPPQRHQIVTVEKLPDETVKQGLTAKIYPNPVKDAFRINASRKVKEVIVRTIEGRVVKHFAVTGLNQTFSIAEFNKGTYVTEVIFEDRTRESSIIVRQ